MMPEVSIPSPLAALAALPMGTGGGSFGVPLITTPFGVWPAHAMDPKPPKPPRRVFAVLPGLVAINMPGKAVGP